MPLLSVPVLMVLMLMPRAYPTLSLLGLNAHLDPAGTLLEAEAGPGSGTCSSLHDEGVVVTVAVPAPALVPMLVPVLRLCTFPSLPSIADPAANQLRAPDKYTVVALADNDSDRLSGTESGLLWLRILPTLALALVPTLALASGASRIPT